MHHTPPTVFARRAINLRAEWLDMEKSKE